MLKILLTSPLITSSYLVLMAAILSLWVYRRIWVWAPILLISMGLAYFANVIDDKALIPIALLAGCHLSLRSDVRGPLRIIVVTVATVVSLGLIMHYMPGFNNLLIAKDIQVSTDAVPFTLYFNYDKPFIGIFVLGFTLVPLSGWQAWKSKIMPISLWLAITLVVMMGLSHAFNILHFDAKLPSITLPWLLANLFFVCIPAEAFWRSFLQKEITEGLKTQTSAAHFIAIAFVSSAFALMHLFFVPQMSYIILAFIASALYGLTYHYTKSVEGAICVHFLLNVTQFFFFTYPALA